ncbi:MAG: 50S ribosomal protein L25 [Crocinitomicaceae bacterium]|nr:50S ribosomal protein L25 [Crocinitomicaceae bacterium]
MKKAQLSGSLRASVGKKDTSALRNAGLVPCVLYGQGEQIHFSVRAVDVQKLIYSPDVYQVELDIEGGRKAAAIIQDLQMHPVKDTAMHVDFLELDDSKPVKVSLPLRAVGSPIGVMNGGKLRQPYRKLRVIGLPGDLPEEISVDVADLRIGDSIRVSELDAGKIEFLEPSNAVVLGVKMARGAADDEEEEEEAEGAEGDEGAEGGDAPAEGGEE